MTNDPKDYDERIILFLDIIAMKDMIRNNELTPFEILEILEKADPRKNQKDHTTEIKVSGSPGILIFNQLCDRQVTTFSDLIVISYKKPEKALLILALLAEASQIQADLIHQKKVISRGGITLGKLYHKDRIIFGEALIRAYELESTTATYPRVVIDQSFLNLLEISKTDDSDGSPEPGMKQNLTQCFIGKDADKVTYVDYVSVSESEFLKNGLVLAKSKQAELKKEKISPDYNKLKKWGWLENKIEYEISRRNTYRNTGTVY